MYRKVLTFTNEAGDKQRVYFRDGICRTPATLDMVLHGGYSWDSIRVSGNTEPQAHLKFKSRKSYEPVVIPPQFAGQQNPPKFAVKETVLDSEGKAVAPKRGKKSSITADVIAKVVAVASEGKTMRETEALLGIPYSTLAALAKKQSITFKAGKKGRQKKEEAPVIAEPVAEAV